MQALSGWIYRRRFGNDLGEGWRAIRNEGKKIIRRQPTDDKIRIFAEADNDVPDASAGVKI